MVLGCLLLLLEQEKLLFVYLAHLDGLILHETFCVGVGLRIFYWLLEIWCFALARVITFLVNVKIFIGPASNDVVTDAWKLIGVHSIKKIIHILHIPIRFFLSTIPLVNTGVGLLNLKCQCLLRAPCLAWIIDVSLG